ncbi:MAG: PAS domain S-box protein, partial [Phycisphaerae bacterium]
ETGVIIDCNRAASELVGREKSELIGKHQRTLHPPQEIEGGISKTFKQHIAEKEGQILEAQIITKKGEIKDVEIRASRFEQKSKKWIQGMFRDITERKKAEQALRESQSRQRAILDSIPDIAWLKDTESRYIAANEALCKAFGIKLEDFVGKTDFDISPEDLAKRYRADDQEVMKSGERKRVEELWGKKEGERIWIETIKTPIYNDQGQVIGTSGIAREITERKKAEEQMREYREKMARAERLASLGSLGAALAHEITQPLTVINLLIENALTELETTSYPGTVANKLKDVLTEVSRIKSVAQKFRDAARRSSERIIKEVDLKAVAERTLKLCDESARRAKVTLQLIDFDRLPSIYSNEEELAQVFFALVDNAIQAACPTDELRPPEASVGRALGRRADGKKSHQLIISGIQKGKHVELRFSDNCSGIAPENLDRIFEPFFTTKPAGEAMGLGLCIVEHIVSRAGGNVHVESKPGKGTTFYITLPIYIHAK